MTHPSPWPHAFPALLARSAALLGLPLPRKFLDPLPPINRQVGVELQQGPPAKIHHPKKTL